MNMMSFQNDEFHAFIKDELAGLYGMGDDERDAYTVQEYLR